MGRQSDLQALTLLGLINSSFITLEQADMIEELRPTLLYGSERMGQLIREFPTSWNEQEHWWRGTMERINAVVNGGREELFTAHAVALFGFILCNDLLEELTDPRKREIVAEAQEILKSVDNYLDPDGTEFETYDEIGEILDNIYVTVGFTREGRYLKHQQKLERRAKRHGKRG